MSQIWMSHVTHIDESGHTYEWSHLPHMNESCHTYELVMPHVCMSHVTHMSESCHTYEGVVSHIWMSHVTHMSESRDTYEYVLCHIWMCHVSHIWMCHVSRIWICHVSHVNVPCATWHNSVPPRRWLAWCPSRAIVTYDTASRIFEFVHTYLNEFSHIWTSHVPHMIQSYVTCVWVRCHVTHFSPPSMVTCMTPLPCNHNFLGITYIYKHIYIICR